jgi:hypothetical protein
VPGLASFCQNAVVHATSFTSFMVTLQFDDFVKALLVLLSLLLLLLLLLLLSRCFFSATARTCIRMCPQQGHVSKWGWPRQLLF